MTAIKYLGLVFFLLLSACATKPPIPENSVNLAPPAKSSVDTQTSARDRPTSFAAKTLSSAESVSGNDKTSKKTLSSQETSLKESKRAPLSSTASKISSWEISGAMAARSKGKGWSASLNWLQRGPGQYQIRLSGPLGSGTLLISKTGRSVTLRDGPKTVTSSDASSLLKQQTGISLPVNNLYYWARGIAAPGAVQGEKRDQAGRLIGLRQAGYTIQYLQYTAAGNAILPSHIRLQGNGVFIKLIIRQWRV
ncbi:lipoprotein insertase outer membrane protein LolB [Legionella fairfieldensis]|uniref:lipoprotein insertase outer membrane protein LolB n=1 Tax=Legionella fairfieldensis TaxID=45064 RepID=UPI00048B1ACC|nr:lipoprotein insertase outer membrane protein LolB [Legionella fairfieldensis]